MIIILSAASLVFSQSDVTPPSISSPYPAALTNSAIPTVGAVVTDDVYVDAGASTLEIDGSQITGLKYDETNKTLSLQWPLPLPDGLHNAVLKAVDGAGNAATLNWTFTTDTLAPTITKGAPQDNAEVQLLSNTLYEYDVYVSDVNRVRSARFYLNNVRTDVC